MCIFDQTETRNQTVFVLHKFYNSNVLKKQTTLYCIHFPEGSGEFLNEMEHKM
jgi:hypothetical protein